MSKQILQLHHDMWKPEFGFFFYSKLITGVLQNWGKKRDPERSGSFIMSIKPYTKIC